MKHATRKIAEFGALSVLIVAVIYLHSSPAVLWRYQNRSYVEPSEGLWVLFNPFRNYQPEYAASAFLEKLKKNKCEEAVVFVPGEKRPGYCAKEHKYKVTGWTLVDRKDEPTKTVLLFAVYRSGYPPGDWGNFWVAVENKMDTWQVTSFETWY